MSHPIQDADANGSRGVFVIDPAGHLVTLPPHAPLKAGWRLADQSDIDVKALIAEEAHAAPLLVLDPVAVGVSEVDAIED